jgi:uncharacterized protein
VPTARDVLAGARLVDHHCHGVTAAVLSRSDLERLLTEGPEPAGGAGSGFDTAIGAALRRWCAPVLDLPAHAPADDYVARRAELGSAEANRRLLAAAGLDELLVDAGYQPADPLPPDALAAGAGGRLRQILRLESVAEEVAASGVAADGFTAAVTERLAERAAGAVALKSVAAYRVGLDLDPAPPSRAEVTAASGHWLDRAGPRPRLADPVLIRHLWWTGIELGLPLQLHTGFGDPDLRLHRSDPALLTDFCAAVSGTGIPVVLLHCYPYHRQAAYLAAVFPHVYVDLGLTLNHVGARAGAVLAETMELAPYGQLLYSSDAFGLAELYFLGAVQFRTALGELLDRQVACGDLAAGDAVRYAMLPAADTARHVYRLDRQEGAGRKS